MHRMIIYIMGVSGSGKTTVGKKLSEKTGIPFFDGDDFHSRSNVEKMAAGRPLDDSDRTVWLKRINELAQKQTKTNGAIIACSALKEKYRKMLSQDISVPVYWVFLQGSYELIKERMEARTDHFMPPGLLASQFKTLEAPSHAIIVDIKNNPDELVQRIRSQLPLPA